MMETANIGGTGRLPGRAGAVRLGLLCYALAGPGSGAWAACTGNPVAVENCLSGASGWDIDGAGDDSIQGFADNISVNLGGTVNFKVKTDARAYRLDLYRMGYYQGNGARLVATLRPPAGRLPQTQPACLTEAGTGLYDCGNWAVSATWTVPANAVSGIYFAKLVSEDATTPGSSHIFFIVRDDARHADILFQASDTTWQAYNDSINGQNLYTDTRCGQWAAACRAYKVSYNRPFHTRVFESNDWVFNAEYPMVRWLEANGYDVAYSTDTDTDRNGGLIHNHKVWMSNGHDEYWSAGQKTNVEAARDAGVHLAFFSGNTLFWKTRWENSIDASGTPYRTLVCYKETYGDITDPKDSPAGGFVWTGTWRDPSSSPPADGGEPENEVKGNLFRLNAGNYAISVPAAEGKLRFWRGTNVATQTGGAMALAPGSLGAEIDVPEDNGVQPPGLVRLSANPITDGSNFLLDYGVTYGGGTTTHAMTLYRAPSGALVFSSGTYQWSWGLDNHHDNTALGATTNSAMQQATVNLLADMGAQPANLQAGLASATASTDHTAPTSAITAPANGTNVASGGTVTISGTATDSGGGVVGGVEVSTDGGATWHPASGRGNWSYAWTATGNGARTLRSRAVDDSGNLETPTAGVGVTVGGGGGTPTCPCTIWPGTAVPGVAADSDSAAVEVGVKFTADADGTIGGIRFYKGTGNTGTHVGKLWSAGGTLLASASFGAETASGWQQANFATPVAITAGTTYVASYFAPNGHYAGDSGYFAASGYDNAPLHALSGTTPGGNGVYTYGAAGGFPTSSYASTNYWVDVVFTPGQAPLSIGTASLPNGTTGTAYSATLTASGGTAPYTWSIAGGALPPGLALSGGGAISGTPTAAGSYGFTVKATDSRSASASQTLNITVAAPAANTSLFGAAVPGVADGGPDSAVELGVRFKSDSAGRIAGLRFYKAATNTGTHTAHLWSGGGTLLASATFRGETASGWQTVNFATPVAIAANTVYVASYHTNTGHYSADQGYFANQGQDSPPLHAPASTVSAGNGVYAYTPTRKFPNLTWNNTNYWVDILFVP